MSTGKQPSAPSAPPLAPSPTSPALPDQETEWKGRGYKDCLTCTIIGTGAFGITGLYALRMARPSAPGSRMGKMLMAYVGVGFLAASVVRWNLTPSEMLETLVTGKVPPDALSKS
ncbi:hypothetical protein HYDPIDRAFT_112527 [Hydnomerulius pinastri MD-312]|uniref:Unplaced genomic scaffold scaffold_14, whole genome shotgun sequence n=1 Tax=Hydnomerulius pinastri MD-312 TaxID=994086 RepID=A0A0C9VEM3_9AGAM|nr:hypothetical protein HYDPIDRAFT_112527 [Hydnomerulius pinastri MD-312]